MFAGSYSPFTPRSAGSLENGHLSATPGTTPGATPRKRRAVAAASTACVYCVEPLLHVMADEPVVELSCGDCAHLNCLLMLQAQANAQEDGRVVCPACEILVQALTNIDGLGLVSGSSRFLPPALVSSTVLGGVDIDGRSNSSATLPLSTPITPKDQIGDTFWDSQKGDVVDVKTDHSDDSSTNGLAKAAQQVVMSTPPKLLNLNENEIDLAKVVLSPQFASITKQQLDQDNDEVYCTLQVSTTKFEKVVDTDENDRLKSLLMGQIINSWKFQYDVNDLSRIILFDYFDEIEFNSKKFSWCQMYLFETALVVISNEDQLILNKHLSKDSIFIKSIYQYENNEIFINLNSLRIPEIKLKSDNKILKFKWINILKRFQNGFHDGSQFDIYDTIPLVQLSTNAWPLVDSKFMPPDIEIINKLLIKGMDLPSGFLQRQLIEPDLLPLKLIVVVPLFNDLDNEEEEGNMSNEQYCRFLQKTIKSILSSLNENDTLGIIFLQNERRDLLGSYYGCGKPSWDGWQMVIESITEDVITNTTTAGSQWLQGLEHLQTLSNLCFDLDDNYVNEVIFITTELNTCDMRIQFKEGNEGFVGINTFIKLISNRYQLKFNHLLLANEYKYEMQELWGNFENLRGGICGDLDIILNYEENLLPKIEHMVQNMHSIIIRQMDVQLNLNDGVKIDRQFDQGKELHLQNGNLLQLRNLPSNYSRSSMIKIIIDPSKFQSGSMILSNVTINDKNIKFDCRTHLNIIASNEEDFYIDKFQLKTRFNNVNIMPQLSNTPNGVFIKRQIERLIMDTIRNEIVEQTRFDKLSTIKSFRSLKDRIWELFQGCHSFGNDKLMNEWIEELMDEIEELNENFNLRNIDLARVKWVKMYLKFI